VSPAIPPAVGHRFGARHEASRRVGGGFDPAARGLSRPRVQMSQPGGRVVYHQCWSRIAFLQVLSKTAVFGTRGSREASAIADSSAPLAGNLNGYIKTPEPVNSHYWCTSIALRVEFVTTAGDQPTDPRCTYTGG
jgi:hypothetical protein